MEVAVLPNVLQQTQKAELVRMQSDMAPGAAGALRVI